MAIKDTPGVVKLTVDSENRNYLAGDEPGANCAGVRGEDTDAAVSAEALPSLLRRLRRK